MNSMNKNLVLSPLAYSLYKRGLAENWWALMDNLVVACSGGADSLALLYVLHEISTVVKFKLEVIHFNHGLRREAAEEAAAVETIARSLQLPFTLGVWDRGNCATPSNSVGSNDFFDGISENASRQARYAFFKHYLAENCASERSYIALAHHLDDQAETVFFRLMRGCGINGLQGMRNFSGRYFRPFLQTPQAKLKSYLISHNIAWSEDASNSDEKFTRNYLRHSLLPLLSDKFGKNTKVHLANIAAAAAEAEDFLEDSAQSYLPNYGEPLDCHLLKDKAPALIKTVIRLFYVKNHPTGLDINYAQLTKLADFILQGENNRRIDLAGSCYMVIHNGMAYLKKSMTELADPHIINAPATVNEAASAEKFFWPTDKIANNSNSIHNLMIKSVEKNCHIIYNDRIWIIHDCSPQELELRNRRPGDWQRCGNGHKRSLKKIFNECKIPPDKRSVLCLLARGNEIVWPNFTKECKNGKSCYGKNFHHKS